MSFNAPRESNVEKDQWAQLTIFLHAGLYTFFWLMDDGEAKSLKCVTACTSTRPDLKNNLHPDKIVVFIAEENVFLLLCLHSSDCTFSASNKFILFFRYNQVAVLETILLRMYENGTQKWYFERIWVKRKKECFKQLAEQINKDG